jgi:redox-sensing transcriptional repressor
MRADKKPVMNEMRKAIPASVIRRFPKYLAHVQAVREVGEVWVSSQALALALGLTSSTVRQDLSHLDYSGVSKRGYKVEELEKILVKVLGLEVSRNMVIVGAGNIGRALALHGDFHRKGFTIRGIFDSDPSLQGSRVGGLTVQSMDALKGAVAGEKIDIGVIAVPASAAQDVADALAKAGVKGLLNLAGTHVRAGEGVAVVDVRLVASLQELAYAIKMFEGE